MLKNWEDYLLFQINGFLYSIRGVLFIHSKSVGKSLLSYLFSEKTKPPNHQYATLFLQTPSVIRPSSREIRETMRKEALNRQVCRATYRTKTMNSASRCLARKAGIPQISVYCLTPGAIDLDTCMRTIERRC